MANNPERVDTRQKSYAIEQAQAPGPRHSQSTLWRDEIMHVKSDFGAKLPHRQHRNMRPGCEQRQFNSESILAVQDQLTKNGR